MHVGSEGHSASVVELGALRETIQIAAMGRSSPSSSPFRWALPVCKHRAPLARDLRADDDEHDPHHPSLIWAMIAGVIALTFYSIGYLGKFSLVCSYALWMLESNSAPPPSSATPELAGSGPPPLLPRIPNVGKLDFRGEWVRRQVTKRISNKTLAES